MCVCVWEGQVARGMTAPASHASHVLQLIAQVFYAWPIAGQLRDHAAYSVYHPAAVAAAGAAAAATFCGMA